MAQWFWRWCNIFIQDGVHSQTAAHAEYDTHRYRLYKYNELDHTTSMHPENSFKCYQQNSSSILKDFYQLDCSNPFLKQISLAKLNAKDDVCELFNDSIDGTEYRTLYHRIKMDFQNFTEKITHYDILKMGDACPGCHHIQLIDGQLFIVQRSTAFNYQTRSRSIKTMLKHVTDTFKTIGNFEMFIHLQDAVFLKSPELDRMKHKVPVFGLTKTYSKIKRSLRPDGIVLIPCFTLWFFTAPYIGRWRNIVENLPKEADKIKWEYRIGKVVWRGARNGERAWLTGIGEQRNKSLLDIEFMDWKPGNHSQIYTDNFKTIYQYCEYKYLLHQEGSTYSNRLKYLLLCGSPVIYANFQGWQEYWYHLLKHDYNVLEFKAKGNETLFTNITEEISKDDNKAKRIGINGRALVQKYLNEQAILCYFRNVLIEYSKLFAYKPVRHPDAIDIDDFLVGYSS
ncbi:unnamed protein product [Rotaria socialis]|uniref:Glycosyl transferase CAP10 domain-containing protein n=2 Tax=Rotaria socialis TaxID=392032 RepID=A0A821Q1S9_9BILA|nr:unnamed protein product [Rotaria socialis]